MKITREEFQRIGEENPLELFHQGIKAKETREKADKKSVNWFSSLFDWLGSLFK